MKIVKLGLVAALFLSLSTRSSAQSAPLVTWTGAVSTAWSNPANWSPARVPLATDNVLINGPSQALFNPSVSTSVVTAGLTLGSGAVLYLLNTGTVNVAGNFTNLAGSLLGSGRGTVVLVGSTVQQIAGPARTSFRNLVVGPAGAQTTGPIAVERGLSCRGNLSIGTNQPCTLLSTPTGPGYVVNAGGTVQGVVTVQRYIDPSINPGLGYRHLSSPVNNTTFSTLQGPGYTPVFNPIYNTAQNPGSVQPFPTVFGYDQSRLTSQAANQYDDFNKGFYSPLATDRMVPGMGYTVNLPGAANGVSGPGTVVTFSGTLTDGNLSVPVARGPQAQAGYELLGNPYASPLDWDKVSANAGTTGIGKALYIYKSATQFVGNYSSYVNGVGTNGGTNVIPLGQAYFVQATGAGQVAYSNSNRLRSDSTLVQRPAATPLVGTRLLLEGPSGACEAAVYFQAGATASYDAAYDATAFPAGDLRLASVATGSVQDLAINGLPPLTQKDLYVPLRLVTNQAGTYHMSHAEGTLPAGYRLYLFDTQGAFTELVAGKSISFTLGAGGVPAERFSLLFTRDAALAVTPTFATVGAALYPNPASGSVTIGLNAHSGPVSVEVINALGQVVVRRELTPAGASQISLSLAGCTLGVYTVRLRTASGLVSQRLIVN